ncbi:MAG: hypothetical protein ACE37M_13180 [Henriciella sp.]
MQPLSPITSNQLAASTSAEGTKPAPTDMSEDAKLRFEKLLWAELLTHTGLEKAMTLGGGEGASMFSRYFVEAIAEDLAQQQPLGLLDKELPTPVAAYTDAKGLINE